MKISVVTAVRNARATVADALQSVVSQSHANREHIVVDGLSTDGTRELLEHRKDKIDLFISEPDTGIYNALNKGLRHCTGDVIGFLHADDLFADDETLTKIARAFRDSNADVVYGDLLYVSKVNTQRTIRYWRAGVFSEKRLAWGWMAPHPTLYVRREVYARLGGFDETYRIAADYDIVLRIFASKDIRITYVPEVLVRMRTGGASNASLKNILRKSAEDYRALRENRVGGLATLCVKNLRKLRQFAHLGRSTSVVSQN